MCFQKKKRRQRNFDSWTLELSVIFDVIFNVLLSGAGDVKPIFAVPLATAVDRSKSHDGVPLPIVVRETIDYIEEFGTLINLSRSFVSTPRNVSLGVKYSPAES